VQSYGMPHLTMNTSWWGRSKDVLVISSYYLSFIGYFRDFPTRLRTISMQKQTRKRVKIRGHYMQVRRRSTERGRKGTILGKWTPAKRGTKRVYRCPLGSNSKQRISCGHRKAGKYCLQEGNRGKKCSQLLISYQ
jgi:hypothetical protein